MADFCEKALDYVEETSGYARFAWHSKAFSYALRRKILMQQ
jgi:hypothetical protein